jgi:hypothetical protein
VAQHLSLSASLSFRTLNEMDLPKILAELKEDLAQLNESIRTLEHMEVGNTKRRGRPPKWLKDARRLSKSKRRGVEVR